MTTSTTNTQSSKPKPNPSKSSYLESLQKDGYIKIPNLISRSQVKRLRDASAHITSLGRDGKWPFVRTVPKQYPPWPIIDSSSSSSSSSVGNNGGGNSDVGARHDIWGIQHLLHPNMPHRDIFAELYFSKEVLDVVRQLVVPSSLAEIGHDGDDSEDEQLVMELFNLLVSPTTSSSSSSTSTSTTTATKERGGREKFELEWHRDDIKPTLSPTQELLELQSKSPNGAQLHTQYNVALTHDRSLIVVPGSHKRVRTEFERSAAPYEKEMPGQIFVELEPGDAVFYDSNILHRGVYSFLRTGSTGGTGGIGGEDVGMWVSGTRSQEVNEETEALGRLTLHGSVGLAGYDGERARQVLQHGVGEWIGRDDAGFTFSKMNDRNADEVGNEEEVRNIARRAEGMRQRLMAMGSGEGLGYSLDG